MGFDLYGINPVVRKGENPKRPENLFDKDFPKKDRDSFYEKKWEFEENNPGSYFRNNCWWWRSLWDYTYNECRDILTEEDWNSGHSNDAHKISEQQAVAIGKRLNDLIKSGKVETYAKAHEERRKQAEEGNKGLKMSDKGYDWADSYPFHLENVQEFAVFCSESGGFEIR
jgi:hypothetical protein